MKTRSWLLTGITAALALQCGIAFCQENRFIQLTGWGGGKPEEVVPQAAEIGCTELIVWNKETAYLTSLVNEGKKHGVSIYACISLNDIDGWKQANPKTPAPLQEMNDEEDLALKRILEDKSPGRSNYQSGGEPHQPLEVLVDWDLLCFHRQEVAELFKTQIKSILAVPGIKGVALDFFGYRNYRCCRCAQSTALLETFKKANQGISESQASEQFSRETLVNFCNELSSYARTIDPKTSITAHVYPLFLPEPLYGNRLDLDVCGQTAAWFFEPFWSTNKITSYSHAIATDAKKHHARSEGSALIGFERGPRAKTVDRVALELQAILDGGCKRVQVCSINEVLATPEVKAVFKKFFKP